MRTASPHHHPLAIALAGALFVSPAVQAQQVVADGTNENPAGGSYSTTGVDAHAFHVLNGGRIAANDAVVLATEGNGAAGIRVEGTGSSLYVADATIATRGDNAAGVSISGTDGSIQIARVSIETQGSASHGMNVVGSGASVGHADILTRGNGAHGVMVSGGGVLELGGGAITVEGSNANAVMVSGAGSTARIAESTLVSRGAGNYVALANSGAALHLQDTQVVHEGAGLGVAIHAGSTGELRNVHITVQGLGTGLAGGGDVALLGGSVTAVAAGSTAVEAHGGSMRLESVDVRGDYGISAIGGARLELTGSRVHAANGALRLSGLGTTAHVEGSELLGDGGAATIAVYDSATLELLRSVVRSEGDNRVGIDNRGGAVTLDGAEVHTTGASSHALYAELSGAVRPRFDVRGSLLSTTGNNAIGAVARKGGSIDLVDSTVLTTGEGANGVLSGGVGEMTLANTHVRTEGEGAWAAVINDNGQMSIDGGSLVSAQHGGIWLRSSRDPALTLSNGVVVSGGNGIGLALDAAVAGRFDVALEGGSQLHGDIVITPEDEDAGLAPQSDVHVRLADGALWQGSSNLVQTLALESGSQWTLTGDAMVGDLQVRDSALALSDGSGRFNTLTVDGDLHSEGATFLFQGALAGDDSAIDRLHVRGDTSGDALIAVRNIGGVGAPTVDGIQLIEVDGASLASYALTGRAVGGSYEYFLFQGGVADPTDGHWYLRSQWFDVCEDDPGAPGCVVNPGPGPDPIEGGEGEDGGGIVDPIRPPPVLRPEAGAYLANQSAAVNMFAHRMHDRTGTLTGERTAWARVGRSNADFTAVGGQLSVDGNTSVLQIGSDLLRRGNAAFGVMLGNGRADSSVLSELTGYSAKGRVRGTALGVYGTWLQDAEGTGGAYVDAAMQFGRFDNRVQGIGLEPEHYDARVATASLEMGHTFNVRQGAGSSFYVQPQLQLTYADYRADRHVESNGTVVDHADAGGLSGRLGVRVFGHGIAGGNTVQPYLGVNWLRGSGTSTLQFNDDTLGADVPRNRYEMQAGAELKLGQRWGAWGGLSVQRGDHGYRNVGGQVGVRMAW
ncbi:autotransporter outer membrane beta-barrel domain-containing protein [Stenotrophomonas sp. AS012628]|uniref:autotransporter family protein n=1 Tax=Stenotrophomonas sp. AS012628 TaxID=2597656 RepID=UPI001785EE02|nr:autotransporter outer membrane beta-barrel domain-containing protein [Stenotrophomonas sp. AS012628]